MLHVSISLVSVLGGKSAYLDPGSGSFLIQLLIAGIAALGIAFGSQWSRIKRWLGRNKAKTVDTDDEDEDEGQGQEP